MKVLDINPNCCWSFHGRDENAIMRLRSAVEIKDPQLRDMILQRIDGKAFGFVGDPTKMDFAPRFFDEVNLNFKPEEGHRSQLQQCVRRWAKNKPDLQEDTDDDARWSSFWNRLFGRLTPNPA